MYTYIYIYTYIHYSFRKPQATFSASSLFVFQIFQVEANWPKAESILLALQKAAAPGHLWPGIVGDAQISRSATLANV